MIQKLGKMSAAALSGALMFIVACNNNNQAAQQPAQTAAPAQVAPAAPVVPAAPAVTTPTAPPATPLIPISDEPATAEPSTPRKSTGSGAGSGIDKKLPGSETSGDELIGNYSCAVDSKQLSIGPFKAPPFGCKIYRTGDGSLKISSSSEGAGSFKGNVTDQTAAGFFVTGKYEIAGNTLVIKARMALAGAGKYSGKGRGRFNDDKSTQINYKLTMTRK